MKPCLTCGRPSDGPYCTRHATDPGYNTRHWRELRNHVLERDQHICQLGHPGCTMRATTVHLDKSQGGLHHNALATDCLAACLHCHGVEDGGRATRAA